MSHSVGLPRHPAAELRAETSLLDDSSVTLGLSDAHGAESGPGRRLFEEPAIAAVPKRFSFRKRAAHSVLHPSAAAQPGCIGLLMPVDGSCHLAVAGTDATTIEGNKSVAKKQEVPGAVRLMIWAVHEGA